MKMNFNKKNNEINDNESGRLGGKRAECKARRMTKSERKAYRARRIAKSELRYRIVENTMRGYFRYSI